MDSRLHELLDIWEEKQELGQSLSAEELCALRPEWLTESPGLLNELNETMRQLRLFQQKIQDPTAAAADGQEREDSLPQIENYRMERIAGRGGMGRVYLAKDVHLGLTVAIKVLEPRSPLLLDEDRKRQARRFVQEAQTLASLNHPHIVRVFAGKPGDERPYFAMEYLPRSLADPLEQAKLRAAGPTTIVKLMGKVAAAVHYAHAKGVLHRDLKPANILLDDQGEPKVCDFGLAKLALGVEESAASVVTMTEAANETLDQTRGQLTQADWQPGTPFYMAPEQHDPSRGPVDARTDVWALGVIMYELLAGTRPFAGETRLKARSAILEGQAVRLRQHNARVSRALEKTIHRCLELDPARRYRDAQALAGALRAYWKPRFWTLTLGLPMLAILLTFLVRRELTPERAYERAANAALAKLKRGERVTIIDQSSDRNFPHMFRLQGGETQVNTLPEGGVSIYTTSIAVVEFLPSLERKCKIIAEIRHDRSHHDTTGGYGVYCKGNQASSFKGEAPFFVGLYCKDFKKPRGEAWMGLFQFGVQPPGENSSPFFVHSCNSPNPSHCHYPRNETEPKWRTIVVQLDPAAVSYRLAAADIEPFDFPAITGDFWATSLADPFRRDVTGLPAELPFAGGAGIFVANGKISIRQFTIVP